MSPLPGPVLVVSSWYPNVVDLAAGRFVADQVLALRATGLVAPLVITFDPVPLVGGITARTRQLPIVRAALQAGIRDETSLVHNGYGVEPSVPVIRLGVADGTIPALGTTAAETNRRFTLEALAERLDSELGSPPALVHAHTGFPDGAAAMALADHFRCPLILTEHVTFLDRILAEPGQRVRYAAAVERAARVIAVSKILADQIRSALPNVGDRLVVIPNAVAVDQFRAPDLVHRVEDELLFVGYRKEIKGIDTLLEAFAIVLAARPNARLRLVGGGSSEELEERYRTSARRLGVGSSISFEGVAGRGDIAVAMARASVFVHASRYETFGVVAAEALAAGLPVVATNSGGITEILGEGISELGTVVPIDDPVSFAAATLDVLDRRGRFDPAAMRASVARRFGSAAVGARLLNLYSAVLEESHASSDGATATRETQRSRPLDDASGTDRIVVVGLDRRATAVLVGALPEPLRARIVLVTASEPKSVECPPVGLLVEIRTGLVASGIGRARKHGLLGRLVAIASEPREYLRRRVGDGSTADSAARAARLVDREIQHLDVRGASEHPVGIVALDGRDYEVASLIARTGTLRIRPGGVRLLADEWQSMAGEIHEPA